MIPITRKELYLNKIAGNNEYETPEKPIIEEEFFFAAILGEAVQAPEPLTRYQIYLAKIAGKNIEIPYPKTRLEYFLARAAGMDVETPVPITKEEIYWSNYTAIVEFELENVPPLTYKAIEGTLKNYRIYGNTVDGESVGDLVESGEHAGEYKVPVTVEGKNLFNNIWELGNIRADNGQKEASNIMICSDYFPVEYDKTYSISRTISEGYNNVRGYDASKNYIGGGTTVCSVTNPFANANAKKGIFKITNSLVAFVRFNHYTNNLNMKYMIVEGDYTAETMPSYEPYHAPVTTPIYLPEPIKMVGDEAEYIDYSEQKLHRIGADDIDVTLPALPTLTGTNVLSVGTEVQPSKVYVKYKGERQ